MGTLLVICILAVFVYKVYPFVFGSTRTTQLLFVNDVYEQAPVGQTAVSELDRMIDDVCPGHLAEVAERWRLEQQRAARHKRNVAEASAFLAGGRRELAAKHGARLISEEWVSIHDKLSFDDDFERFKEVVRQKHNKHVLEDALRQAGFDD